MDNCIDFIRYFLLEISYFTLDYGPASVDGTSNKDRSMRSPVVVMSSPQTYGQFTAPSPGTISSVPSPGILSHFFPLKV